MNSANRKYHILFVCSKNQWRSPTAEKIWSKIDGVLCRSAGTSSSARHRITESDILWADFIFVMEQKHKKRIKEEFRLILDTTPIEVLDIPDEYQYMDSELVEIFEYLADRWFE